MYLTQLKGRHTSHLIFFFFLPTLLPSRTVLTLYSLILGLQLPLVEQKAITHAWNTDVRGCLSSLFVILGGLCWAGFPNVLTTTHKREEHSRTEEDLENKSQTKNNSAFRFSFLFIYFWLDWVFAAAAGFLQLQ